MVRLYGGKGNPHQHHVCCNYARSRVNKPCSQCDHIYWCASLTQAEHDAHLAAQTVKIAGLPTEITLAEIRRFLTNFGYEERRVRAEATEDSHEIDAIVFQHPGLFYFIALPTMKDDDQLRPVHLQNIITTLLNNAPTRPK